MRDKNVPYYLLIHTNSYTGNFERELIAYCFGILPNNHKNYGREYIKAFWNYIGASDIDTLEEYINFTSKIEILDTFLEKFEVYKFKTKEELKESVLENNKLLKLYSNYLNNTVQDIDDKKEESFYNIESFYKNKEYNCDTICIQLKEPLNNYLEAIVISRIKQFFENDIFNIIENYRYVCEFGDKKNRRDNLKLLDLELVNEKNELIKKYV